MQHVIRMPMMSGTDLGADFWEGVRIAPRRGARMLKNDVQMTVRPRQGALMRCMRLVREHRQSTGPRTLERDPSCDEKDCKERSKPEHGGQIRRPQDTVNGTQEARTFAAPGERT